jgi:hypothetical protein
MAITMDPLDSGPITQIREPQTMPELSHNQPHQPSQQGTSESNFEQVATTDSHSWQMSKPVSERAKAQ